MKRDTALSSCLAVLRFALALTELGDLLCGFLVSAEIRSKVQLKSSLPHCNFSAQLALFMKETGDQIDPSPSIRTAHTTLCSVIVK